MGAGWRSRCAATAPASVSRGAATRSIMLLSPLPESGPARAGADNHPAGWTVSPGYGLGVEPIFRRQNGELIPTEHAIGPWDAGQLHGGGPAGLIAEAIQQLAPDMQMTRAAYEFLGPVPNAPLTVNARLTKPGRRLQLAEGTLSAEGRVAMRATAVLLRRTTIPVPDLARWDAPLPATGPLDPAHAPAPRDGTGFHRTGMTIRFANGTSFEQPGPAQAWFALDRDLVAGEPISPATRVVAASDFGNGLSRVFDWDEWLFLNCDLTVRLLRDPATQWVLLDAVTRIDEAGIGWASSTLYDEHGPIGAAQQTLFVEPR